MVGARSHPQRLPRLTRSPRPRAPIRLPLAALVLITLIALVLAKQTPLPAVKQTQQVGGTQAASSSSSSSSSGGSSGNGNAAASASRLVSVESVPTASPKEATQQALELLRSLKPASASSAPRRKAAATTKSATSLAALSPYWDILTSWSPLGTVFRLVLRVRNYVRPDHAARGPTWEGAGTLYADQASASPYVLNRAGEEHEELLATTQGQLLWPAWDGGWTAAMHGPFLCSTYASNQRITHSSYTDRALAFITRPLLNQLPPSVRRMLTFSTSKASKLTPSKRQAAADARRSEALALLAYASGFAPSPRAAALAEPDWSALLSPPVSLAPPSNAQSDPDALFVLATLSQHGMHGTAPNAQRAQAAWASLAAKGNATAHTQLGWFLGGAWHGNASGQSKALLHYHIAARAGDQAAQMTLGYRYNAGIGVAQSCSDALEWYESAALQTFERFNSGPPGGLTMPYAKQRLSDAEGGVYGPGASAASTGHAARRPAMQAVLKSLPSSDPSRLEDLLEFYTHHAQRGHAGFALRLAQIWYTGNVWNAGEGAGRVGRDFARARAWCLRVTEAVWPMDSKLVRRGGPTGSTAGKGQRGEDVRLKTDDSRAQHAASAAAMIGRMHLRGEGVPQNFARAWVWFNRAADLGDTEAYNGIGIMYRDGLGMKRDMKKAVEYFEASAGAGQSSSVGGCVNLAKIHVEMGDYSTASKYFDLALRYGSSFEAFYHLAAINSKLARSPLGILSVASGQRVPIGAPGTPSHERCRLAVVGYKHAVERADWHDPLFARAEGAWARGDKERALSLWAMAGERGYEPAQNNVAWILDRDKKRLRLSIDEEEDTSHDRLALIHWTRSAAQDNVDALVKVGDYYFHGIGLGAGSLNASEEGAEPLGRAHIASAESPSAPAPSSTGTRQRSSSSRRMKGLGKPAYDKAAACYAAAADRQESALAYWNMGWLYECGLGVPQQDFHLAKRYYDMAVEINPEAYLPVMLSLIKLHAKALWATFAHADSSAISLLKSYVFPPGTEGGAAAYTEGEERAALVAAALNDGRRERAAAIANEQQQHHRDRLAMGDGGDPNLPETYDRRRGRENQESAAEQDADMRLDGGTDEDLDDIIEGAMIVIGLAALAFLVYVRQGAAIRAQRERREGEGWQEPEEAEDDARAAAAGGRQVPRGGAGVEPPFPWPPEQANAYAGL